MATNRNRNRRPRLRNLSSSNVGHTPPIGTTKEKPFDFGNLPITRFNNHEINCERYVEVDDSYYHRKGYNCTVLNPEDSLLDANYDDLGDIEQQPVDTTLCCNINGNSDCGGCTGGGGGGETPCGNYGGITDMPYPYGNGQCGGGSIYDPDNENNFQLLDGCYPCPVLAVNGNGCFAEGYPYEALKDILRIRLDDGTDGAYQVGDINDVLYACEENNLWSRSGGQFCNYNFQCAGWPTASCDNGICINTDDSLYVGGVIIDESTECTSNQIDDCQMDATGLVCIGGMCTPPSEIGGPCDDINGCQGGQPSNVAGIHCLAPDGSYCFYSNVENCNGQGSNGQGTCTEVGTTGNTPPEATADPNTIAMGTGETYDGSINCSDVEGLSTATFPRISISPMWPAQLSGNIQWSENDGTNPYEAAILESIPFVDYPDTPFTLNTYYEPLPLGSTDFSQDNTTYPYSTFKIPLASAAQADLSIGPYTPGSMVDAMELHLGYIYISSEPSFTDDSEGFDFKRWNFSVVLNDNALSGHTIKFSFQCQDDALAGGESMSYRYSAAQVVTINIGTGQNSPVFNDNLFLGNEDSPDDQDLSGPPPTVYDDGVLNSFWIKVEDVDQDIESIDVSSDNNVLTVETVGNPVRECTGATNMEDTMLEECPNGYVEPTHFYQNITVRVPEITDASDPGNISINAEALDSLGNSVEQTYYITVINLSIQRPYYHNILDSDGEYQRFGPVLQEIQTAFNSSVIPMGCKGTYPITQFKFKYEGGGTLSFNGTEYNTLASGYNEDDGFITLDVTNTADELGINDQTYHWIYSIGFEIIYTPDPFFTGTDSFIWTCTSGDVPEDENDWAIMDSGDYTTTKIEVNYSEIDLAFGYDDGLGITIEQSLSNSHDPMSGISVITDNLQNTKQSIEGLDSDKRPSLGMFYYDDNNPLRNEFTVNLPSPFTQITKPNLIENGNGRMVLYNNDSTDHPFSDTDTYTPRGWGYLNMSGVNGYYDTYPYNIPQYYDENFIQDTNSTEGALMYAGYENYTVPSTDNLTNSSYHWAKWKKSTECYSYGKCLYFDNHNASGTNEDRYIELNQYQQIDTTDILPFSPLKVSFWMKTTEDDNGTMPEVEAGVKLGGDPGRDVDSSESNNTGFMDIQGYQNSIIGGESHYFAGAGRFKNSVMDKWEKMEYTFNLDSWHLKSNGTDLKDLWFMIQWGYDGRGIVWLDNFSVTNGYNFIPDTDVRMKKGENEYGTGLLTEYYDPNISDQLEKYNDTLAPLEAAFYFYPRYNSNEVFDFDTPITYNDFRNGMYYIYDVDWGDGSPNEFISEPEKLGDNKMIYHTYETSGIYEVTGTMLRMKPDRDYNPLGIAFNQRFTLRININEGLDEDFKYFGSDGFSFIPYKNTLPVIGGYGKESIYYKSVKRQLGFISDDIKVDTQFEKPSDKLKTEVALQKMEDNLYRGYRQWEVDYYQQTGTHVSYNIGTISTLGSPTLSTTADWSHNNVGGHVDYNGMFNDIESVFGITHTLASDTDGVTIVEGYFDGMFIQEHSVLGVPNGNFSPANFTAHYSTWIYVDTDFSVAAGFKSDNRGYFYINDVQIATDVYDAASTAYDYTYNFIGGNWYKLDIILNEGGGGDYAQIGWNVNETTQITDGGLLNYEILPHFTLPRFENQDGTGNEVYTGTLYGGIKEELGDSVGDVDITNIRYFNEPKQMYEMLGFDTDAGGIPDNPRYWKNIIPEGTSYMDRVGITLDEYGIYDINTTVEQTWNSGNYYPVLPNYNKFGLFNYDNDDSYDYVNNNIPFPLDGMLTNEELNDSSLKINITSNQIESNILDDLSGNQNHGFAFSDYRPNFDNQTLEPKKVKNTDRIRSSKNDGAF